MSLQEQQKRLLLACIATAVVMGGVMYVILAPSKSAPGAPKQNNSAPQSPVKTPGATVQSNELWMQKMTEDSQIQSKKLDIIEKVIHKQLGQEGITLPGSEEQTQKFTKLEQEIAALKKQVEDGKNAVWRVNAS